MRPKPKSIASKIDRRRNVEQGVVLVLVMIFLALMLLMGLAIAQTTSTEVSVGRNVYLAADAFGVADAGAAHAYELVRNMRGDFTCLLRGADGALKTGDEFAQHTAKAYNVLGVQIMSGGDMFVDTAVKPIPETNSRALARIDARHFYELVPYDNAYDPFAYLAPAKIEDTKDPGDRADIDADQRVLIRSIGYVMADDTDLAGFDPRKALAVAVVDIVIGLTPYPAIVSNSDLKVTNAVQIDGSLGGVHANDDLVLDAGAFSIEQSATFGNSITDLPPAGANDTSDHPRVQGFNGNSDALSIPDLNPFAQDIARRADYVVLTPGSGGDPRTALYNTLGINAANAVHVNDPSDVLAMVLQSDLAATPSFTEVGRSLSPSDPLVFSTPDLTVTVNPNNSVTISAVPAVANGKTVFVLMPDGSLERVALSGPLNGKVTVITNGSMFIEASVNLQPNLSLALPNEASWTTKYPPWYRIDLLALAGGDLTILGTATAGDELSGVIYAHEQFDLFGSGELSGQVVSFERELVFAGGTYATGPNASAASFVPANGSIVRASFRVNHDSTRGYLGNFAIAAWRQLRDFDPVTSPR